VCAVSGGSSGIGAATAILFARNGWNVLINYARDAESAETVRAQCVEADVEAIAVQGDISSDPDCRAMAKAADERWGRADVLVNSAGCTKFVDLQDLEGMDSESFRRIQDVNVLGTFQMTRAFVPLLRRHAGAAVVNVSSVAGTLGIGSSIAYMASKGAINALTVGLARALCPAIRVNAVAPGLVETPWLTDNMSPQAYEARISAYKQRVALADTCTPEDVAAAIWWLGVGARKTTGEVLIVDCGEKLRRP
jgi:NAD(P)-dependent dehydrogenase (short-subunit alcohol dehydrogenase family)